MLVGPFEHGLTCSQIWAYAMRVKTRIRTGVAQVASGVERTPPFVHYLSGPAISQQA
jgi:hypothetical protein